MRANVQNETANSKSIPCYCGIVGDDGPELCPTHGQWGYKDGTGHIVIPQPISRAETTLIDRIIRDVAEIERNPLPGQPDDEMRITADELRGILEARFEEQDRAERERADHEQYGSTLSA